MQKTTPSLYAILAYVFAVFVYCICMSKQCLAGKVSYSRDISPILTTHCFKCHGPDESSRKSELRLDRLDLWIADADGKLANSVIRPGRPRSSELYKRITSDDPELRMPPVSHASSLAPTEVALIKTWIQQGALYERHWAFQLPVRPTIPAVKHGDLIRTPIDAFIQHTLEGQKLTLSHIADDAVLIRRLYLDVTGLPPINTEMNSGFRGSGNERISRIIERLLHSPQFGEKMAQTWLDLARYADTTGHAADKPRTMWLYRDWVINAINANMPFDQFTIEQLAGDMLDNPDSNQLIATGFHRNSIQALGNNPRKEEFRIKGIVDRLETTGKVWLGLAIGCAECHDHKYDPISQREYYELFAIFNNVPHLGERFEVHGPQIQVIPRLSQAKIASLEQKKDKLADAQVPERFKSEGELLNAIRSWAKDPPSTLSEQDWRLRFNINKDKEAIVLVKGMEDAKVIPVELSQDLFSGSGPLPGIRGLTLRNGQRITVPAESFSGELGDLSIGMWIRTTNSTADLVSKYDWQSGKRSFVFGIGGQKESGSVPGALYFWSSERQASFSGPVAYGKKRVDDGKWHHIAVSYDAGQSVSLFVDGELDSEANITGPFPKTIAESPLPLVIGAGFQDSNKPNAFFLDGQIADVRIAERPLTAFQLGAIPSRLQPTIARIAVATDTAVPNDVRQLFMDQFLSNGSARASIGELDTQIAQLKAKSVTAQIMDELPEPRSTYVHVRGNFEERGEQVSAGVPDVLLSNKSKQERLKWNRLAFAKSLVDGSNPLVARVTVNRIWAHYFGKGLVADLADFGMRGGYPIHRDLLDWLAVEFVESGWDVKHIHSMILNSAVYQQTSVGSEFAHNSDPENRFYSRMPRIRLTAEQIRDQALVFSGQFANQLGGPSVYPYQPDFIGQFRDGTAGKWINSPGSGQFRRSIYTFWQRMSPYPSFVLFDAPSRERCTVARPRTNTPLQALTLLNDRHFVELAKLLGSRIRESAPDNAGRIEFAFQCVLGRSASADEKRDFIDFVNQQLDDQAWFLLAQVMLNLDETITRE